MLYVNGKRVEEPLKIGEVAKVDAGVPHILYPKTDILTFEWWSGDFIVEDCKGIFDDLIKGRSSPKD